MPREFPPPARGDTKSLASMVILNAITGTILVYGQPQLHGRGDERDHLCALYFANRYAGSLSADDTFRVRNRRCGLRVMYRSER